MLLLERLLPLRREAMLPAGVTIAGPGLHLVKRDPDFVARAHARGYPVYVWTVDEPADVAFVLDLGVDTVITDRPREVRTQLDAARPASDLRLRHARPRSTRSATDRVARSDVLALERVPHRRAGPLDPLGVGLDPRVDALVRTERVVGGAQHGGGDRRQRGVDVVPGRRRGPASTSGRRAAGR